MSQTGELVTRLKAIADPTRLQIANLLLSSDLCVRAIAKRLELSESTVSQHLKILREAGFVRGEKRGYWTHYSVQTDRIRQLGEEIIHLTESPLHAPDKRCTHRRCDASE